jgi:uncharacterized membrane protein
MSETVSNAAVDGDNERPSWGLRSFWLPVLVAVLSLVGVGVSGYLTYTRWFDKSVVCAGLHSCQTVAESSYSHLGPVPVSVLGVLGYAAILAVAAFWLRVGDRFGDWPLLAIWGMSVGGVVYSIYLTYVELFVIDAVCIWCVTQAVVMLCVFILTTAGVLTMGRQEEYDDEEA